jgi:hypothetical protein
MDFYLLPVNDWKRCVPCRYAQHPAGKVFGFVIGAYNFFKIRRGDDDVLLEQ